MNTISFMHEKPVSVLSAVNILVGEPTVNSSQRNAVVVVAFTLRFTPPNPKAGQPYPFFTRVFHIGHSEHSHEFMYIPAGTCGILHF